MCDILHDLDELIKFFKSKEELNIFSEAQVSNLYCCITGKTRYSMAVAEAIEEYIKEPSIDNLENIIIDFSVFLSADEEYDDDTYYDDDDISYDWSDED